MTFCQCRKLSTKITYENYQSYKKGSVLGFNISNNFNKIMYFKKQLSSVIYTKLIEINRNLFSIYYLKYENKLLQRIPKML